MDGPEKHGKASKMKEHKARCVTPGTARRIMALGSLAIGFPLPNGSWSIEGCEPFAAGEKIEVTFASKNGAKVYGKTIATVKDRTFDSAQGIGGKAGCFAAIFDPIGWPAKDEKKA